MLSIPHLHDGLLFGVQRPQHKVQQTTVNVWHIYTHISVTEFFFYQGLSIEQNCTDHMVNEENVPRHKHVTRWTTNYEQIWIDRDTLHSLLACCRSRVDKPQSVMIVCTFRAHTEKTKQHSYAKKGRKKQRCLSTLLLFVFTKSTMLNAPCYCYTCLFLPYLVTFIGRALKDNNYHPWVLAHLRLNLVLLGLLLGWCKLI